MNAEDLTPEQARALLFSAMAEDEGFRRPERTAREQHVRDYGTEPTAADGIPPREEGANR